MKPIATVGSMHTCPMCTGTTPHVGGPIIGPGIPTVLVNNKPVAVVGDQCACSGPPDVIAQGASNVFIGGKPVASVGDMTAHGGMITEGSPNVFIGTGTAKASKTITPLDIPFPKIDFISRLIGLGRKNDEAKKQIQKLREQAAQQEEEIIFNLQWQKSDQIISGSKVFRDVTVHAEVSGIPDGKTANFTITEPAKDPNQEPRTFKISGTVQNKKITQTWRIEEEDTTEET